MKLRAAAAMLLALAVPGAGHAFLGKRARAAGFFVVVTAMFLVGLAIGGGLYRFELEELRLTCEHAVQHRALREEVRRLRLEVGRTSMSPCERWKRSNSGILTSPSPSP